MLHNNISGCMLKVSCGFFFRFAEMVQWMDNVDISLQSIVKEVNTLEEFEKERAIFQVSFRFIHSCGFVLILPFNQLLIIF